MVICSSLYCKLCQLNIIESEYHFMLCCPLYRDLRSKYCIISNFPTLYKFYRLMSSKQTKIVRNVAKFISSTIINNSMMDFVVIFKQFYLHE